MIVLQATWAEPEGGPGEHHRRAGTCTDGRSPSGMDCDGWKGWPATRARSRWRGAPGGGSWPRSCAQPGFRCSWPSRPRPRACVDQSSSGRPHPRGTGRR